MMQASTKQQPLMLLAVCKTNYDSLNLLEKEIKHHGHPPKTWVFLSRMKVCTAQHPSDQILFHYRRANIVITGFVSCNLLAFL